MYLKIVILVLILIFVLFLKLQNSQVGTTQYNKARTVLAVFVTIVLILQSGLRHVSVGPDTYNYYCHFIEDIHLSWSAIFQNFIDVYLLGVGKDAGYVVFEKLFSLVSSDYQIYLIFVATLFFSPLMFLIYNNTKRMEDIWLSVLIYFSLFYHFFSVTGIRQTVATSFCLIAYNYIQQRKIVPFFIIVFCGAMIHKTALIFLPFYWIAPIRQVNKLFFAAMILFPVMCIMGYQFTTQLALLSGSENYIGYADEGSRGAYNLIMFYIFVALVVFWKYRKNYCFLESHSGIFNAVSLGLILLPLSFNSPNLVRLAQYYSIFIIPFMGYVNEPSNKFPRLPILILLVIVLIYKVISTGDEYIFFWENNLFMIY